jgi:hypothetical protein
VLSLSRRFWLHLSGVRVSAAGTGRLTQIRASRRALAVPLPQSRKAIGRQMDGGEGGCLGVFGQTHAARRPHLPSLCAVVKWLIMACLRRVAGQAGLLHLARTSYTLWKLPWSYSSSNPPVACDVQAIF